MPDHKLCDYMSHFKECQTCQTILKKKNPKRLRGRSQRKWLAKKQATLCFQLGGKPSSSGVGPILTRGDLLAPDPSKSGDHSRRRPQCRRRTPTLYKNLTTSGEVFISKIEHSTYSATLNEAGTVTDFNRKNTTATNPVNATTINGNRVSIPMIIPKKKNIGICATL